MSLKCGIVGLPNVGKSTLFNALTKNTAETANYPFCTIDPNVGIVKVPDPRLDKICALIKTQKVIPAVIEFVDIAGLVKGASQGEGLGNQFLQHIRETNAIIHVVRCFDDPNIIHVEGDIDPIRDMDTINTELLLSDFESVEKRWQKVSKAAKADKKLLAEADVLKKLYDCLEKGQPARSVELCEEERIIIKGFNLLTIKPVLYACNVNEEDFTAGGNSWTQAVDTRAKEESNSTIIICSALEAEIAQLEDEEQKEFLETIGAKEPGLDRLIRDAYELLNLQTFFTAGEKEIRAWTIKQNDKAPGAAGVIHSDFEKGFIRAETYHCKDLFELKDETAIKSAGRYRSEGKDYIVQDGDVMLFRFNV